MTTNLINPITFTKQQEEEDSLNFKLDFGYFKNNEKIDMYADGIEEPTVPAQKKKRKKKEASAVGEFVPADSEGRTDAYIGTTIPYVDSFTETNNMTKAAIAEIDDLNRLVKNEITNVTNSKTLKKKYEYITELAGTSSNLIATKMRAISELNKTISDSHKLEIQRIKDLRLAAAAEGSNDDDRRMQELYNSFISTPTNMGSAGLNNIPPMNQLNYVGMISPDNNSTNDDIGYNNYINNLTPEQNLMRLEASGNIETVLIYDPMTGARRFGVVDRTTGAPISNVPVPSDIILENTHIDSRTGMARNRDINATYRVITVGNDSNNMLNHI